MKKTRPLNIITIAFIYRAVGVYIIKIYIHVYVHVILLFLYDIHIYNSMIISPFVIRMLYGIM